MGNPKKNIPSTFTIKFSTGKLQIVYYLIPTITIDFSHKYDGHKIFIIMVRFWKWQMGFTIFYDFNIWIKDKQ